MEEVGEVELPPDFSLEIPREGLLWLFMSGIGEELIYEYNIGWSEKMGRVVIPIYDGDNLIGVQCRAVFTGQVPKYMNRKGNSKGVFWANTASYSKVVITEDILSAIKVGRLYGACSTLGTVLHDSIIAKYLLDKEVIVWYDGDEAGRKGSAKAMKALNMMGVDCREVLTDKDPKEYNIKEARDIICG